MRACFSAALVYVKVVWPLPVFESPSLDRAALLARSTGCVPVVMVHGAAPYPSLINAAAVRRGKDVHGFRRSSSSRTRAGCLPAGAAVRPGLGHDASGLQDTSQHQDGT